MVDDALLSLFFGGGKGFVGILALKMYVHTILRSCENF